MEEINKNNNESFFGYYIFVAISSVIGFIALMSFSKLSIKVLVEKNLMSASIDENFISVIVAIIGVVIFVLISLLFKNFFSKIFLSELFLYLYMGVLTTAVNIICFQKLTEVFANNGTSDSVGWKLAEILAFIIAVIFAYVTNKIFVFKSSAFELKTLSKEFAEFSLARIITEVINFLIMWFMIDKKGCNELLTKIMAGVIVIILNYIFSKFIIFKKNEK